MKPRVVWFIAGSAAGLYASVKAKRAAYRLSMPGLVDQAAALGTGWRAFSAEVRNGMHTREAEVMHQLNESIPTTYSALTPTHDSFDKDTT